MNHTITVPTSAAEIPLHRYVAFTLLPEESKFDFHIMLSTIAGCTVEEAKQV